MSKKNRQPETTPETALHYEGSCDEKIEALGYTIEHGENCVYALLNGEFFARATTLCELHDKLKPIN